jgi:hypothetical protein
MLWSAGHHCGQSLSLGVKVLVEDEHIYKSLNAVLRVSLKGSGATWPSSLTEWFQQMEAAESPMDPCPWEMASKAGHQSNEGLRWALDAEEGRKKGQRNGRLDKGVAG